MEGFLGRIRERKLVQWAIAYLAGAWLILQVADLVGQSFDWPGAVLRAVMALLVAGFLATLVLSWYHGERGHQRVTGPEVLMLAGIFVVAAALVSLATRERHDGPGSRSGTDDPATAGGGSAGGDLSVPQYGASVAVLPFDDLGASDGGEYFSEGITEEIIGELARIEGLKVISRTSVVALKGTGLTLPQIADTLAVRHVLQGAVRRSGNRVRVTVQLIDPRTDTHLWFETFDRLLDDIFSVQEEVAGQVGRALLASMGDLNPRGPGSRTGRSAAYDAYLRGTYAQQRHSPDRLREAMAAFEEAIALDSTFAPAYAGLSSVHGLWALFAYPGGRDPYNGAGLALQLAARAAALDPTLAEAHAMLGHARLRGGMPYPIALRDLERAVDLAPSSGAIRRLHAVALANAGRFDDAVRASEIAVALDPLSPGGHDFLAVSLTLSGRYEEALTEARIALAMEPQFPNPRRQEARALLLLGRYQECAAGDVGPWLAYRAMCLHSWGAAEEAWTIVESLVGDFAAGEGSFPIHPGAVAADLAEYHAWIGDVDGALTWLERAADMSPVNLLLPEGPTYDRVRSDPRFRPRLEEIRQAVVARVVASARSR